MKWKSGLRRVPIMLLLTALLPGCGVFSAPQLLALSMASTVVGGYANGAVMGGSTVGVIRNVAFAGKDDDEAILTVVSTPPPALRESDVQVAGNAVPPRLPAWLERACYFPNASGHSLPCS